MGINNLKIIARKSKYQCLYNHAKEMSNIQLFINNYDFSPIQIYFLQLLNMYSSLYMDLSLKKPNISEKVINNDIRTEAYLYWKQINEDKENKPKSLTYEPPNHSNIPKIIFVKKQGQ